MVYKLILYLFLIIFCKINSKPVVNVHLPGLTSNQLWAFCVAKIISQKLDFDLVTNIPIYGFPNTYNYSNNKIDNNYPQELHICNHDIDIKSIVENRSMRNIFLSGYFQRYEYIKDYLDVIKNDWLKITDEYQFKQNPDDIVIHIRCTYPQRHEPFAYYEKALSMTNFNQIYICSDDVNHPFLKLFEKYTPMIVKSQRLNDILDEAGSKTIQEKWIEAARAGIKDFMLIRSFNKIIIGSSGSTYGWWAALLSAATEIYAPKNFNDHFSRANFDQSRYHYIDID